MQADTQALLAEYCQTRSIELRNRLSEEYLYLAGIVARRFSGRGVDYDDLYQVASMALLKALERFDCSKGIKFSSFATPTMVGEVKNFFRDRSRVIRMPRRSGELLRAIEAARERLEQQLQRSPTAGEIALDIGCPVDDVLESLEMRSAIRPASLEQSLEADEDTSLQLFLGEDEPGYGQVDLSDMMTRALSELPEQDRRILTERYYHNRSQRDIAMELNISQMTVSRAERRALKQIQKLMTEE